MPQEPLSTIRQLELTRDLQRLANERTAEEQRLSQELEQAELKIEEAFAQEALVIDQQWETVRQEAEAEFQQRLAGVEHEYESQRRTTQKEYQSLRSEVEGIHSERTKAALEQQQETAWETWTMFEAVKDAPKQRLKEAMKQLERSQLELSVLEKEAAQILEMRRISIPEYAPSSNGIPSAEHANSDTTFEQASRDAVAAAKLVHALTGETRVKALSLYSQKLPQLFESGYPLALPPLLWALLAVPSGILFGWGTWHWIAISVGGALATSGIILAWLYPLARNRSIAQFKQVHDKLAEARAAISHAAQAAKTRGFKEAENLLDERDSTLAKANEEFQALASEQEKWKNAELGEANSLFPSRLAELRDMHKDRMGSADGEYREKMSQATVVRDQAHQQNQAERGNKKQELQNKFDADWKLLANRWFDGLGKIQSYWNDQQAQCDRLFPDWATTDFDNWQKPDVAPEAIQFGNIRLELSKVKNGISQHSNLIPRETSFRLPALMAFEEHPIMVVEAEGPGREEAVELLELMMLRLLTAIPPGKVRLTIFDPVGLGESFASFMHLADYDERIISTRIWTEGKDINDQLTRLTTHMETVLQKYLRNEFATIYEYNEHAGEVAEPFQIVIAANFPANFNDETARRLVSIATSGPRCGVFTLMSIDRNRRLPTEFRLDDMLESAVRLQWQSDKERFRWKYPAYEHLELTVDQPPPDEQFVEVVRGAGRAAKKAIRVEVPFSLVAPDEDELWKSNSGNELVVPVGRAGATRLQSVRLGKGTAQHLLISGKTGSGKSTFLHALITNAALYYSPEELELYLIDFKKGVEFKCYASGNLPHARVIAIESEREFGVSVLENLNDELRRRGDLFRKVGVQDLAGFRKARPDEPMPRVLLIVDEFQEIFVEDDKLAADAGLLLDRLVRQGRAFGMHVLLGSQTLSGAYSLARSTMGQMGVRVALQCSEADAHLILSDERNNAARYLSRPGEAIYNDQNGLLTGNSPFQVVWLDEAERFDYLEKIVDLHEKHDYIVPPPIVFEGNAPADLGKNPRLLELLAAPPAEPPALQRAWIGAAVAIKDPTSVTFSRHAGSNLLVVGHREESAVGVLSSTVLSLAAQSGNNKENQSRFIVLDGTRPESPEADAWQKVTDAIGDNAQHIGLRDAAARVNEVAEELKRRESAEDENRPPIFLVIYNGGRFRDLRRNEDDFSFSMDKDKPASPDKSLAEILKNGPAWGIHLLVWCDSYNNVNRMFDRLTLREFEMRILFQMSAADSSSLLDSPAASKLAAYRGLFYSDESGTAEKFRPYGPPSDELFQGVL